MKYKFKFEDIVKYEIEVEAKDEYDARQIVQFMEQEELHKYEVDRRENTPTTLVSSGGRE